VSPASQIDVRFAARKPWVPSAASLRRWANLALKGRGSARAAVFVHVVGKRASRSLNARYRRKDAPTNVLSFAGAGMSPSGVAFLGEIVICAPVLAKEAREQGKSRHAHWAHITVHGVLHLLGFDHIKPRQARQMEMLETQILESMGFSNPYG
jgi:probable rRNA maturation factor